jgi:hypothetical protein
MSDCPKEKLYVNTTAEGPVPQLGPLMLIPFNNGAFQSNTIKLAFTNDGNLQSASVAEHVSGAEVASDTFNQVATNLLQGVKDIRTGGLDAKTAMLKAKTGQLQAQKDYNAATIALQASPTADTDRQKAILDSDTALKDALRANIEAEVALEKAKAAAGAASGVQ